MPRDNPVSRALTPLSGPLRQAAYGAAQAARIGWYTLHYVAGRHRVGPITPPGQVPPASRFGPYDRAVLIRRFRALFREEWRQIEAGAYNLPHDMRRLPDLRRLISGSRGYMREAEAISRRAHRRGHSEVRTGAGSTEKDSSFPGYYLQNFHYQSDGWLSEGSARIYDMQVETLFTGAADAMRRQALPFIRDELVRLAARGEQQPSLVDLACGTGRLLSFIKDNWPGLDATAIDLSPDYLAEARRRLAAWPDIAFLQGLAEKMPLADDSADILVSVYLFHELPPKVRRQVAGEIARVLKPGGLYLHLDTLQYGDEPGLDALLEGFPRAVHEPYYDSYCREDLPALFGAAGLTPADERDGFLTKVSTFRHRS